MKAILQAVGDGCLRATVCIVIANSADAPPLLHARTHGIPTYHLNETKLGVGVELGCVIVSAIGAMCRTGSSPLDTVASG